MSEEKIKSAATATFTQFLTQHKLRRTPERFAILEKVFETPSHFCIDTLHSALEESGYHVSRATVYNTIELLIRCGLVRRHTFGNQSPQYEKIAGLTKHYHLVCSMCGKIREVKDAEIDALLEQRRFGKFIPAYIDLNIYGLCGTCSRRANSSQKRKRRTAATEDPKQSNQSRIKKTSIDKEK